MKILWKTFKNIFFILLFVLPYFLGWSGFAILVSFIALQASFTLGERLKELNNVKKRVEELESWVANADRGFDFLEMRCDVMHNDIENIKNKAS